MKKFVKPAENDWRRQGQEKFLYGINLVYRKYSPYRPGWDHDHCDFCGDKFSLSGDDLEVGYSSEDKYHWICNPCFKTLKMNLRGRLESICQRMRNNKRNYSYAKQTSLCYKSVEKK